MALENALFIASISHARQRPKANAFTYKVYYLSVYLSALEQLKRLRFFGFNRPNLYSFYERDYAQHTAPELWIRELLAEHSVPQADGEVTLVTMPRLFGYAFNPVSFWFCHDSHGALRAIFADVTNTFGERHGYLVYHEDRRPIAAEDWLTSQKVFHVSPFIEIVGHYAFRCDVRDDRIAVWINHYDNEGLLLTTSMVGKRHPLTSRALISCFFRMPLVTFKVIGLIHLQAMKLFTKGVRYHVKPTPPMERVSR